MKCQYFNYKIEFIVFVENAGIGVSLHAQDLIMRKVNDLFHLKSPAQLKKRENTASPPLNSQLILGRAEIIKTLEELGVPENINDFQQDVLEKIISRQAQNLPTDKDGNPVLILLNSDRDNSTTDGKDILSPALRENMGLVGFKAKNSNQFLKLNDYLQVSDVMNQAQNHLLRTGVPVFTASGALKPEALNRINNGEAPPIAAAWFTGTQHSVLAGYEAKGTNKGTVHYSHDIDYERLLNDSVIYDKHVVVEKLKNLIENDEESLDVKLRFQPSMDDVSQNKFITSLHLNTNLSELDSFKKKVQESLGDQYSVKADIDAKGNSLRASQGMVTQMYINIEPKKVDGNVFDGKETYFLYMDDLVRNIASEQKLTNNQKPEIVTFGIADSDNDIASITSPLTKGLAIIPSNAVHIRDPNSKLMQKLSEIPDELKTSLQETLIEQGATQKMAEKLSSSVKVVSQNPSRFIYFTEVGDPNEKMSLSINNGYKVLHALIHLGKFTQE